VLSDMGIVPFLQPGLGRLGYAFLHREATLPPLQIGALT
jgi:hypothetical protein